MLRFIKDTYIVSKKIQVHLKVICYKQIFIHNIGISIVFYKTFEIIQLID